MIIKINILFTKKSKKKFSKIINKSLDCNISWINDNIINFYLCYSAEGYFSNEFKIIENENHSKIIRRGIMIV